MSSERIQRAITLISENLDRPLTLEELAGEACLSRFHFARMFRVYTGETPGEMIRRLRLERGAYYLIYNPVRPVTRIALECGFSSSQNFARAFAEHFQTSPSRFRRQYGNLDLAVNSNPGNIIRNPGNGLPDRPVQNEPGDKERELPPVRILDLPERDSAVLRLTGHYRPDRIGTALDRLGQWAALKGLLSEENPLFGVFWDNTAVTPDDRCRFDASVVLTREIPVSTPFQRQRFRGGVYALGQFTVSDGNFYAPWNRMLKEWLPGSGYELDERPCIERYTAGGIPERNGVTLEIGLPILVS